MGNKLANYYHATYRYKSVTWIEENNEPPQRKPLDQTRYFSLSSDTIPVIHDTAYWQAKRNTGLTPDELQVYHLTPQQPVTNTNNFTPYLKITATADKYYEPRLQNHSCQILGSAQPFPAGVFGKQRLHLPSTITYQQDLRP